MLKVARFIVDFQKDFFEYGAKKMKPLILNDVARALEMHESTISRVTTNKFMYSPHGMLELKYFFSSHFTTSNGGECSSTAIRALIKQSIDNECEQKPLSDNKLVALLAEKGINIARRTISKYREEMNIPPSYERKYI
jgi:RNA polymerase sigma-54 factor